MSSDYLRPEALDGLLGLSWPLLGPPGPLLGGPRALQGCIFGTLLGKEFLPKLPSTPCWDMPWTCLKLATELWPPTTLTPRECGGLREAVAITKLLW